MANVASNEDIDQATFNCREVDEKPPEQFSRPTINEFEDIYVAYRPRVWALCLRMTGNPDDAEDLTQETFIRIYQKLDTFRGESTFCTWLRRVAVNVVLLRFQKACWRHETSMETLTAPDPVAGSPCRLELTGVDNRLMDTVDRVTLLQAFDQLSPGFKAILLLHDVEGYAHVEISELMGCSVGTSKSQLHKARLKMRELLQETPPGHPRHRRPWADKKPVCRTARSQRVLQFPGAATARSSASVSVAA